MKKLGLIAIVILLAAFPVFAVDPTSTVLTAVVGSATNVTNNVLSTTNILQSESSKKVGTFTFTGNTETSWTVTITSSNLGDMVGTAVPTNKYPYKVAFKTATQVKLSSAKVETVSGTGVFNLSYDLMVYYDTAASLGLPSDTYSDTITVTIASAS